MKSSQFYSGVVAELYDSFVEEPANADDYAPFLDLCGTPALELACGSGNPMLDLLARGYDVEGLDSSADMLEICRTRGQERGLTPVLHQGLMQTFRLPNTYRSIFLAGASLTLLDSDEDALNALKRIHAHLRPGGNALIPIAAVEPDDITPRLGQRRDVNDEAGNSLSLTLTTLDMHEDGRSASIGLRYEQASARADRIWHRRWWSQQEFCELALSAGFQAPSFLDLGGQLAQPDAMLFVALLSVP